MSMKLPKKNLFGKSPREDFRWKENTIWVISGREIAKIGMTGEGERNSERIQAMIDANKLCCIMEKRTVRRENV